MRKTKTRSNSGIYKITNTINNKCYIGSAVDVLARFYTHKNRLETNRHHSIVLQRAWNKYGKNSFTFEILEDCSKEELIIREQFYINSLTPEYNICKTAGNCLGVKHTKESNLKKSVNSTLKGKFGKDNPSSIEIYQYDLDGTFITKWNGLKEIERCLNYNSSNIGKASLKSDRTCYGFFWSRVFLGEKIKPIKSRNREKCKKAIEMLDMNGNVIRSFESQKDATKFLGLCSNVCINYALKNKVKHAYGYKWRYKKYD